MTDSYRHKGLRKKLVQHLKEKGISNSEILEVIGLIPRHFFLDKAFEERAYEDIAFPILAGQTISQPFTVAFQTNLLEIKPKEKVLEIGTGSGYQASVLALLKARVFTIERQKSLFDFSQKMFKSLNLPQIRGYYKDGYKGLPSFAPFDKILVTAGSDNIPDALLQQLTIGGVLVIPVGDNEDKTMLRITRKTTDEFVQESFGIFRFVPFLKGLNDEII